jgi:hypothetical protein
MKGMCVYKRGHERPNRMHSKYLMLKSKPRPLRVERDQRGDRKILEYHLEGIHDKLDNVFDAKPYHTKKIKPHNQNMECHEGPHPYPSRMMKQHNDSKLLKQSNQNENPREAQELKKEGPP